MKTFTPNFAISSVISDFVASDPLTCTPFCKNNLAKAEMPMPLSGKDAASFIAPSRADALRQGRLILVAEDNETNQKVILRQLGLLGLAADVAANGREALESVFRQSVDSSFNAISVDGCMSTNDTALILANGFAGNPEITKRSKTLGCFGEMLSSLLAELARGLVRDGEGATKVIEITVEESKTTRDARRVAYAIANSNLVKTAFFGGDPNWGRIISAAGSVGIDLPVNRVRLFFEDVPIFAGGKGICGREEELAGIMKQTEIRVRIGLGMGRRCWTVCASDLSFDYVKINAHYHT